MGLRQKSAAIYLASVVLVSCGGGQHGEALHAAERGDVDGALAAYERAREDGRDPELLRAIASALLVKEATGADATRARAATSALASGGTRGVSGLSQVASRSRGVPRAMALAALVRLGDGGARERLRALAGDADPDVQAQAVVALDADTDLATLRHALAAPHAALRSAAATQLAKVAAARPEVRSALAETARTDAEASVRAAATRALGRGGPEAVPALRERLADREDFVRMAAVDALVSADRAAGLLVLGPLLELPPNAASVEAARMLSIAPAPGEEPPAGTVDARAYLLRALAQGDPALRAQAAVAVSSLGTAPGLDAALGDALSDDEPQVRLSVAATLIARPAMAVKAKGALRALVTAGGLNGVEAAALLAEHGDHGVARFLGTALHDPDAVVRRAAVRAIAVSAHAPDAARSALRDESAVVRIAAAAAILQA